VGRRRILPGTPAWPALRAVSAVRDRVSISAAAAAPDAAGDRTRNHAAYNAGRKMSV